MASGQQKRSGADHDRQLVLTQTAYLDRCAPGYRTHRVRWSGGGTQLIELGEGPPLLLLHGGLSEAFLWGPILPQLARRHRVLAVDRPGHGLADPFNYHGVDLLAHGRQFVAEVLDAEQLPSVPIAANSMGGLWSVCFALAHPERVPRLVLVGAPAGMKRSMPTPLRLSAVPVIKTLVRALMKRPTRESTRRFWKQILVAHPERLDDDLLDVVVASQIRNAPSWFTLIDRALDSGGLRRELILGERWKSLTVPTTFVWGEKDAFGGPEEGEAVAATNPRLRVVRVPDAGHTPWLDEPERVVDAIETALSSADVAGPATTPTAQPAV